MKVDWKRVVGPWSALLLAACASTGPAPVTDLTAGSPAAVAAAAAAEAAPRDDGFYTVGRGDTLYAIALAQDLDWRDLARWNRIGAPYTIRPGMRLALSGPAAPVRTIADTDGGAPVAVFEPVPNTTAPAEPAMDPAPSAAPQQATPAPASTAAATADAGEVLPAAPAAPVRQAAATAAAGVPARSRKVGGIDWSWPAEGGLEERFEAGNPARQGIDVGGQRGAPVRAAASGEVVYSGNGLVGYGELVIIKHSDRFLSAYGHNSARLVKEGERVARGQSIAEMGSSGASHVALHFEIRAEGKPVDPLAFLPARQ